MAGKILIAYASRTGSTREISEFIGNIFSGLGDEAEIWPVNSVTDITPYKTVILGSAVQAGKLLPEAMDFIHNKNKELAKKPFAVFLVCMTLAMKNGDKYRSHVSGWLDPVRKLLNPVSEGMFSGILEIQKIPTFRDRINFRISVLAGIWKKGDNRDWNQIQKWTEKLKELLDKSEVKNIENADPKLI